MNTVELHVGEERVWTTGELGSLVEKSLAWEPGNRFASATEMRAALTPFAKRRKRKSVDGTQ